MPAAVRRQADEHHRHGAVRGFARRCCWRRCAWWVLRQPALRARRHHGATARSRTTTPSTLRANVAPQLAGNFFTVDLAARAQAFEAVPWVRQAVVRREFPNRLRVQLQEHRAGGALGRARPARGWSTASARCSRPTSAEVERTTCRGWPARTARPAQVLGMYRARRAAVRAAGAGRRAQLTLTGRGSWQLELDTGAVIELGRGDAARKSRRARSGSCRRSTQVASRIRAAARGAGVGRPAPRRRLCAAIEGRRHGQRRRAEEETREH